MDGLPPTVTAELPLMLLHAAGPALPLQAELRYDSADPYAVEALFDAGGDAPVRWVFSRELLADGLHHPAGQGDVSVRPCSCLAASESGLVDNSEAFVPKEEPPTVELALTSPDGAAVLEAPAHALQEFLDETYQLVAPGDESQHLDLDAAIAALLNLP